MLRLLAFLITGVWPSQSSLQALGKRMAELERALRTLEKKHNTLAGSYYQEFDDPGERDSRAQLPPTPGPADVEIVSPGATSSDFPEDEFQDQLARRRERRAGLTGG